jgi:hypothetical protein
MWPSLPAVGGSEAGVKKHDAVGGAHPGSADDRERLVRECVARKYKKYGNSRRSGSICSWIDSAFDTLTMVAA